jgi:hypothetical protein
MKLLQIPYGYMQRISLLHLVSNRMHEKIRLLVNKKGKFICLESPYQPEIKIKYLRNFQN